MTWYEEQSSGMTITHDEWNNMVTAIQDEWVSGSYSTHRQDGDIHFPSSSIRPWLDGIYKATGATSDGFTPQVLPDAEDISSIDDRIYFSGQGTTYVYSGANTVIISSQIGSAGNLSDLTIDANKDWNSKGIRNMSYLSSQTISGGTINGGNFYGNPSISSQISGTQLISRAYPSKPTASNHAGEIIRTSSNSNGTWVWISVYNGNQWVWLELGSSTPSNLRIHPMIPADEEMLDTDTTNVDLYASGSLA